MKDETPYDLITDDTEQSILKLLNNSGLAITTMSLLIDKIKFNLDAQKYNTVAQLRLNESKKIIEEQGLSK